jgi:lipoprotein-anchoring transpeptidase ErfK/SrfK
MAQHSAPLPATAGHPSRRSLVSWAIAGVVAVLAVIVALAAVGGSAPEGPGRTAPGGAARAPPAAQGAGGRSASTTFTTVDAAPPDRAPSSVTDGLVVHPVRETTVHDVPDGRPIARMEPTQLGDTWLPVIAEKADWVQVLLPSKPNGSTGWLRSGDLERAKTPYTVEVHLGSKRLELLRDDEVVGEWTVGIGKESAPTPTGRTFLLGAFTDDEQEYSPVILPLGAHSPTHDTFGGGPGTVAIHTWPTDDVYGTATSDGCIRVPPDALDQLSEVPLGTLVMIDED